jgi:hypothetical protein
MDKDKKCEKPKVDKKAIEASRKLKEKLLLNNETVKKDGKDTDTGKSEG